MTIDSKALDTPAAVLRQALTWFDAGEGAALVTVMRTWSSAPARPGSLLAVNRHGARVGSVSAGVIDRDMAAAAVRALDSGQSQVVDMRVSDAAAQNAGLPCGGEIALRIEPLVDGPTGAVGLLREVVQAVAARRGVVLCTRLSDANRLLVAVDDAADTELAIAALRAAAVDSSGVADVEREPVLFQVFNPPLRLFIVGGVHIAQALVTAAALVGFEVAVIDPRPGYASPERFPGVRCFGESPEIALRMVSLDRRSAVVTLSHDAAVDDPALIKALHSKAFYVGALGSRKTHRARLKRLHETSGVPERLTARLHGPAGLSIGAIGPAEIAAAIVAELIAELRGRADSAESAWRIPVETR